MIAPIKSIRAVTLTATRRKAPLCVCSTAQANKLAIAPRAPPRDTVPIAPNTQAATSNGLQGDARQDPYALHAAVPKNMAATFALIYRVAALSGDSALFSSSPVSSLLTESGSTKTWLIQLPKYASSRDGKMKNTRFTMPNPAATTE